MKTNLAKQITESESYRFWLKKAVHTTNSNYDYGLIKFLEWYKVNPDQIVAEWKKIRYDYRLREQFVDKWTELMEKFYYRQLMDYAPLSRRSIITPVISFFKCHKIPVDVDIRDRMYVKYSNKDITKEEIRKILKHSSVRERTFYFFMIEAGLRPNTIVQLKYRHVREDYEANKTPMKIEIPVELLKDRVGDRFSFLGADGVNSLREYLGLRKDLNDDDLIFQPLKPMKHEYIVPETFSSIFSRTVLKLGIAELRGGKPKKVRLYSLRKYFRNNIRVGDTAYREFWMGHTFGTDEHYISRDVEEHREMYRKAYPTLRIYDKPNPKLEDLERKYEELKRENEQLRANNKDLKKLREEIEELKELNKLLEERDFIKMLKKFREGEVESVEE